MQIVKAKEETKNLISVKHLKKYFAVKQGLFSSAKYVKAVDDISFHIPKNSVFGIVGESGSGKTTLMEKLIAIYAGLKSLLREKAYLTIIVKNVKKGGKIYPLAWDLGRELAKIYTLKDEKLWCQDNQRLAPFGLGSAWVSNTFHHYCLQFRNEL